MQKTYIPYHSHYESQIEKYFKCPFMHYVDYALKPKAMPKFEIKKLADDALNACQEKSRML